MTNVIYSEERVGQFRISAHCSLHNVLYCCCVHNGTARKIPLTRREYIIIIILNSPRGISAALLPPVIISPNHILYFIIIYIIILYKYACTGISVIIIHETCCGHIFVPYCERVNYLHTHARSIGHS